MKQKLFTLLCALAVWGCAAAKTVEAQSPDGSLRLAVDINGGIAYTLWSGADKVLENSALSMQVGERTLGENPVLRSVKRAAVDQTIDRVNPTKNARVRDHYNAVTLNFKGGYAVEFRIFNDGAAYRFVTSLPGEVVVADEACNFHFPEGSAVHLSQTGGFRTMCEEAYTRVELAKYTPNDRMSYLPVLVEIPGGPKVLLTDADVRDYPCQFVLSDGTGGLKSTFPRVPKEYGPDGDRSLKILSEENYIARTDGARTFPWRVAVVAKDDAALIETELVYLLAAPTVAGDWNWVKPGLVSWEWWNGKNLTGVDFRTGCNTETYRYYIDFAAKYNIPYILMDEGWSVSTTDVLHPNADLDVRELIAYAKERDVQVVLWVSWLATEKDKDMEKLFATYAEWGVPGVKIDFMDRSDQWMVNYYERVMQCAAKHRMFVDMHGSFPPKGLHRTYPNFINYEAVLGMEQGGRCQPANSNFVPFIRGAVGPMDFTPGSMFSAQPWDNRSTGSNPMGSGTRAYQMALFVLLEAPIQMLADNPQLYMREHPCTEFLASVPTTWDELRVLRAKCGEQLVVARRKGAKWYIGGFTGDKPYSTEVVLDFLPAGNHTMTSFEDGVNADRQAMDYRKRVRTVDASMSVQIDMARNGGWAAVIE